eukprot:Awhi_evm1s3881
MKRYVSKLTTSSGLKLASGTPGLRWELSRRDNGKTRYCCKLFGCQNHTFCSQYDIEVGFFHRSFRQSITYPFTLNNLSTISNVVSTSNYTSTNTLTYSSRVITLITSTTTTTTTLSYNSSNSLT